MRRRCCCTSGGCVITVIWLRDTAFHVCRVVVGATVTAYDSIGGVIDAQTTDENGRVNFSLETCRTAWVIIAAKAGYTVCGTGVDRIGHGASPWTVSGSTLYLFPETLPISCGAISGDGLVTVTADPGPSGFTVNWRYAQTMGGGSECGPENPYGLHATICGGGSSAGSIQFAQSLTNGGSHFLAAEGYPVQDSPLYGGNEAYLGCHMTGIAFIDSSGPCPQWLIDTVSPNITDPQDCAIPNNALLRGSSATITCPTGDPVATGTIAGYADAFGTEMSLIRGPCRLGAPP